MMSKQSNQNIQDSKIRNRTKARKLELNLLSFVQQIFQTVPIFFHDKYGTKFHAKLSSKKCFG